MAFVFKCLYLVQIMCANMKDKEFVPTKDSREWGLVSGAAFLDTRRRVTDKSRPRAETYPVKIRITYKGRRTYYKTGAKITKDEWPLIDATTNKKWKDIKDFHNIIEGHVKEMNAKGEFSFDNLNVLMARGDKGDVYVQFDTHTKALRLQGRINTAISFECTKESITRFAGQELKFSSINKNWLERYEAYMESIKNKRTTRSIYLRTLRSLINKTGNPDPFAGGKFQIKKGEGRSIALTRDEMNKLLSYPLVNLSVTHKMRDLFEFSYRCNGINPKDIINLKWEDNVISDKYIIWKRSKTARKNSTERWIKAKITDRMKAIITSWGIRDNPYVFGYLTDDMTEERKHVICQNLISVMNDHLNIITKILGLPHCTSYVARHSFASLMKNEAPLAYISGALGHASLVQTQDYLGKFEDDDIDKYSKILD